MTQKSRTVLLALAVVGGALALRYETAAPREQGDGRMLREQRSLMGTVWNIEVPLNHHSMDATRSAVARAWRELERIDAMMSEWKPASPISQVNAAAGLHSVEVPAELRALLERSIRYSVQTGGTFDVTWRGMGRIWHFDDSFRVPTAAEVAVARQRIDYRRIRIEGNSVFLPAGMNIGLGGIAKGYAVDRAALVLNREGFRDSLVDGGGDILASGTRYGAKWRLGVQDPRAEHGEILGVVEVSNQALVSSGDYERFRIVDGVRYHHIIDPRSGWPARESIAVTVLAATAEQGVVLEKGVFILGGEEGLGLARAAGLEVLLIDRNQQRHVTPGFHLMEEHSQE